VSLELARRVVAGLPQHPDWLELARANLERWSQQNQNAPSLHTTGIPTCPASK